MEAHKQCLFIDIDFSGKLWIQMFYYLLGLAKSLQYFGSMRDNLAVLDAFAEVMKMINNTGLLDTNLAWYSLSAIYWICFYGLESMLSGLPDLAWSSRLLQPKQNFLNHLVTVINWTFCLLHNNIIAQFELIKYKFSN